MTTETNNQAETCCSCGSAELKTEEVTQQLPYGTEGESFTATFEVHTCTACGVGFSGWKGEEQRTTAQFKFEKAKGMVRTRFSSDDERKLWDAA